jgi:hypothetical protein
MEFTAKEKLHCIERELALRQRVYARLVEKGKMSPEQRDHEIELMTEIAADYRTMIETATAVAAEQSEH